MNKNRIVLWMMLGLAMWGGQELGAEMVMGARKPALSADGSLICFSYLGDLWTVPVTGGTATRLTIHQGYDTNPAWSPDGQWLAFTSEREGNDDVYIMPARGGKAKRLTWHSSGDWVTGWTPDSQNVLFYSWGRFKDQSEMYRVSIKGGTPEQLTWTEARYGTMSPDGSEMVYFRLGEHSWRKGYNGSANADLWLVNQAGSHSRLTEYNGNDLYPHWTSPEQIHFLSDRDGFFNIWSLDPRTGQTQQVTRHDRDGIDFLDVSSDDQTLVYAYDFGLWVITGDSIEPHQVQIEAFCDQAGDQVEYLSATSGPNVPSLAPDGKRLCFSVQGELVMINADPEYSSRDYRRLTTSAARDYRPVWSPDGLSLAFISDRDGTRNIWRISHLGTDLEQITFFKDRDIVDVCWSPDGQWLAFQDVPEDLYLIPARGGKQPKLLVHGPELYTPTWSPDSRWIAYEKHDENSMGNIFIVSVNGGEPIDLTRDRRGHDMVPTWHPDGKRMLFLSDRDEKWNVWLLRLTNEPDPDDPDYQRKENDWEKVAGASATAASSPEKKENTTKNIDIQFVLENIDKRVRKITNLPSDTSNFALSPDGSRIAFTCAKEQGKGNDIWSIALSGKDEKQHTSGLNVDTINNAPDHNRTFYDDVPFWSPDSTMIYFLNADQLHRVALASGEVKAVPFAVPLDYERQARFEQMYRESWRGLRDYFYDSTMHGTDWPSIYEKYEPMLDHIAWTNDFHELIQDMYGELDASHLGIWSPTGGPAQPTGYPGFSVEPTEAGFFRVTTIVKDSPADDKITQGPIRSGDYILAINNNPVHTDDNFFRFLNGTVGRLTELLVHTKPTVDGARTVTLVPLGLGQYLDLLYENETDRRKELVKQLSKGRVAYHHIRWMSHDCLKKFERSLYYEFEHCQGLVLDVRDNGGGNIHEQLIDILERRPFAYAHDRHNVRKQQPQKTWPGPIVLLINQNSFSDAEVFPHAFRERQLGTIVGMPTAGGVIGTGGITLIDGSHLRLPGTGWFGLEGTDLENYGVPPDIYIENDPNSLLENKDLQLEKAVQVLLDKLEIKD
ncbi:PD40 domain-containing protein [bacterium]|nr:PD40 domain-containing protein [bacterium]